MRSFAIDKEILKYFMEASVETRIITRNIKLAIRNGVEPNKKTLLDKSYPGKKPQI